jgi:hypothetical protein
VLFRSTFRAICLQPPGLHLEKQPRGLKMIFEPCGPAKLTLFDIAWDSSNYPKSRLNHLRMGVI